MVVIKIRKKVLIVTTRPPETNSSSSIRVVSTIKSLLDVGVDVTVLSTKIPKNSPNYNNTNINTINTAKRVN